MDRPAYPYMATLGREAHAHLPQELQVAIACVCSYECLMLSVALQHLHADFQDLCMVSGQPPAHQSTRFHSQQYCMAVSPGPGRMAGSTAMAADCAARGHSPHACRPQL